LRGFVNPINSSTHPAYRTSRRLTAVINFSFSQADTTGHFHVEITQNKTPLSKEERGLKAIKSLYSAVIK
jgi:hypothetical protein